MVNINAILKLQKHDSGTSIQLSIFIVYQLCIIV